eukprot:TRINITY_DN10073_c0_g1_i1.p1 TRINITY_DN10073_c0_g1~~TRINITY_DN10073_c0_g1_i1.p1  ORF type:complete len:304 (-),score=53.03 TRINITY_DN10073_c0_g1_i1:81-992(-)
MGIFSSVQAEERERDRLSWALHSSSGESSACVQETEDPTSLQHEFGVRRNQLRVELLQQSQQQLAQSSVQWAYSPDDNEGKIMPLIEEALTREPAHIGVEVAHSQSIEVLFQVKNAKLLEISTDDHYDRDQRSFFKHIIELITFSVLLEKLTDELVDASKWPGNKDAMKLQFHRLAHRIFNMAEELTRMSPVEAASILKDMRELGHSVQSAEASGWGWVQYETPAKLEDFHYEFQNSPLDKAAKSLVKAFWLAEPALSSIVDKELALFQAVSTEQIVRGASKTAASVMGTMVHQFSMSVYRGE